jgi:hypothetical protein
LSAQFSHFLSSPRPFSTDPVKIGGGFLAVLNQNRAGAL